MSIFFLPFVVFTAGPVNQFGAKMALRKKSLGTTGIKSKILKKTDIKTQQLTFLQLLNSMIR